MEQAIYKLLTLNKNAVNSVFTMLKKVKGLKCVIYPPMSDYQPYKQYDIGKRGSIFGLEDLVGYDVDNCYEDKLLCFNLFQEGYIGTDEFDTFNTGAYCLTKMEDKLPLQTMIEINFYGRKMYYKVDDHKNLTPSVTEQLLIKNMLVPQT